MNPWPYDLTAPFYDIDMAPNADPRDGPWYIGHALAACATANAPVLELGCGTGRLSLPLAAAGLVVEATDRSAPMLAVLRGKADAAGLAPRIRTHLHDMGSPATPVQGCGAVVCAYSAFAYLVDEAAAHAMLQAVAACLRPGGVLLMDLYIPDPALAAMPPDSVVVDYRRALDPARWSPATVLERSKIVSFDVQPGVNGIERRYRFVDDAGRLVREVCTHSLQRPHEPAALLARLDAAGFDIVQACGDFDPSRAPRRPARTLAVAARPRGT